MGKSVGALWFKERIRDGVKVVGLSGYIDTGHKTVDIVPNKYKQPGDSKPNFFVYPHDPNFRPGSGSGPANAGPQQQHLPANEFGGDEVPV